MIHAPSQDPDGAKIMVTTVANPGANTDFLWGVPAQTSAEIVAVYFVYTSNATAANRTVRLMWHDGSRSVLMILPNNIQIESLACPYYFTQGAAPTNIPATEVPRSGALPTRLIMPGTWTLNSDTINMQLTDAITNIVITYRRFPSF